MRVKKSKGGRKPGSGRGTKRSQRSPRPFERKHIFLAYDFAKCGLTDTSIAKALDISGTTFFTWLDEHPLFAEAVKLGREKSVGTPKQEKKFLEFVYDRLPDELQETWRGLVACEKEPNAVAKIEGILEDRGIRQRQQLFLYALVANNFNPSKACRSLNMGRRTLYQWLEDPDFAALWAEIDWCRKNFYEEALVDLVAARDPSAVLFVNRTVNRDRGYSDKQEVAISGQVTHEHTITLADLELPLDVRKQVLFALRKQQELIGYNGNSVGERGS